MPNETATKKRLSVTVYYLLTGMALGWPGLLATARLLPDWQQGASFSALTLGTVHLLILGTMLTVAFGVLYQIVPIAFQAPPIPRHVLYWHLPLHLCSVVVMVVGFLLTKYDVVGIGGIALLSSGLAYFSLVFQSYRSARNKTAVHKALAPPFAALWLTVLVGVFQALFPGRVSQSVFFTHVLLGGFAFWGGLVLVFSYKLVPMFAISHGYKASLPRSATLYFAGVGLGIVAPWIQANLLQETFSDVGGACVVAGLISYSTDMVSVIRARKRRRLVLPLYDALLAMAFFVVGHVGVILSVFLHLTDWMYASIYLFAFGGLLALMFSFMQKIVPFLWFEYRFSKRPERKTAPLIDDMVPKWTSQLGMGLHFIGVAFGCVGFISTDDNSWRTALDFASAACLTLGSILLFFALRHVLTIGGRRPADEGEP